MYLSMHVLQNLKVFEYMKHTLELRQISQQLHLIHTSRTMFCHALQISVSFHTL